MKLVTKTVLKGIPPLYKTENIPLDEKVIHCKFFGGAFTFYVAEASEVQPNGDITFFGFTHNANRPDCSEWGYFTLKQLEGVKLPPLGQRLERDMYFKKAKFGVIKSKNFVY